MLQRIGVESLVNRILAILTVACVAILLTPWLVGLFFFLPQIQVAVNSIENDRFLGFFTDANLASITACYAVVLALCLSYEGRYRKFANLVWLLGSVAVILTFSRMGITILALIFLLFLAIGVSRRRLIRANVGWLSAMIVLVTSIIAFSIVNIEHLVEYLPIQAEQIRRLSWKGAYNDFYDYRGALWSLGLSQIAESPLFGHGVTHFHHLRGAVGCGDTPCGVHSVYLMLWGEAGIIPLVLLLLFISSLLWRWWTLPRSLAADASAGCALVFALTCMTLHNSLYFIGNCFIIGASCALMAHANRESRGRRAGGALQTPSVPVQTGSGRRHALRSQLISPPVSSAAPKATQVEARGDRTPPDGAECPNDGRVQMVLSDRRWQGSVDPAGVSSSVAVAHASRFRPDRHRLDSRGLGEASRPGRPRTCSDTTRRTDCSSYRGWFYALDGARSRHGGGGLVVRAALRSYIQRIDGVGASPGAVRHVPDRRCGCRTGASVSPQSPVQEADGGRPPVVLARLWTHGNNAGLSGIRRMGARLGRDRARFDPAPW